MPMVDKQALMPYSAKQMYMLVDDIPAYPEFLPWCAQATEHNRSAGEVRASLTLAAAGIQRTFTTVNRLQPYRQIDLVLDEGPFKHLHGYWRFEEHAITDGGVQCQVILHLDYALASKILQLSFGPVFQQMANTLVQHFCQRAHQIYGAASSASSTEPRDGK